MVYDEPVRLREHFAGRSDDQQGAGWSELWDSGENDLWDRGFPSPALIDLIEERQDILSPINDDGTRKRALVAGCGKGYDPVMLALHGYDAWGLDISATAVSAAEQYKASQMQSPSPDNFAEGEIKGVLLSGNVSFIQGDFFTNTLEANMPSPNKKFDLIYDYTFLCALAPSMRRPWADRVAELLQPGGLLICLEFPMWKDLRAPGPPWGLKGVHWNLLAEGGDGMIDDAENTQSPPPGERTGNKFVRELYLKPMRSYKNGQGQDMLSLWRKQ